MQDALHSSPTKLSPVLIVNFLESFAYYGFRAVIVLFMIDNHDGGLGWSTSEALTVYGTFTMLVYLCSLLGGLIADFILGSFKTTLLGLTTMAVGLAICTLLADTFFYEGALCLAVGCGMFRANILVLTAHLRSTSQGLLDSAFTQQNIAVNLGAFMSPLLLGYIGEQIGWRYNFAVCFIVLAALAIAMYVARRQFSQLSMTANIHSTSSNSIWKGLSVVIATSVLAIAFWFMFEITGSLAYPLAGEDGGSTLALTYSSSFICLLIFAAIWWQVHSFSSWLKVGISFLFMGAGLVLLKQASTTTSDVMNTLIAVMAMHAIAETFFVGVVVSLVVRYGYTRLLSTSIGILLFATAMSSQLSSNEYMQHVDIGLLADIAIGIALVIVICCSAKSWLERNKVKQSIEI